MCYYLLGSFRVFPNLTGNIQVHGSKEGRDIPVSNVCLESRPAALCRADRKTNRKENRKMKCSHCGAEFEGKFCTECGAKAEPSPEIAADRPKPPKTKKPIYRK